MTSGKRSIFFYTIICLAVIGILTKLITNPAGIFKSILIMLGTAIVIFLIAYFILKGKKPKATSDIKKYKQAVKQSKLKYQSKTNNNQNKSRHTQAIHHPKRKEAKRPSHLRVIEGKKDKNNDRANF